MPATATTPPFGWPASSAMTVAAFTIAGCFLVPRIANRFGRRATLAGLFGLMIIGAVGTYGVAYPLQSIAAMFVFLPILGLGGANFAVFTIWLPEQYPTRMRATAFAFTTTLSRWFAAVGTFLIGYGIHARGIADHPDQPHRGRVRARHRDGQASARDARSGIAGLSALTVQPGGRGRSTAASRCSRRPSHIEFLQAMP